MAANDLHSLSGQQRVFASMFQSLVYALNTRGMYQFDAGEFISESNDGKVVARTPAVTTVDVTVGVIGDGVGVNEPLNATAVNCGAASGSNDRWDLIVARWSSGTSDYSGVVIQGVASSVPIPPRPAGTGTTADIPLALIYRSAGVDEIEQTNIIDIRSFCAGP